MSTKKTMNTNLVFSALKSRWYICLISTILFFSVAAYYVSNYIEPLYIAKTTIFISNDKAEAEGTTATNIAIAEKLKSDCQVLVTSNRVLDAVKSQLPTDIQVRANNIAVTLMEESRVLVLSVSDTNAENAALIANAVASALIVEAKNLIKIENMQTIDHAKTPTHPDVSRPRNMLLFAFMIGISFGFAVILLLELFDKVVRGPADIEATCDLPVLALIPQITSEDTQEKGQSVSCQ